MCACVAAKRRTALEKKIQQRKHTHSKLFFLTFFSLSQLFFLCFFSPFFPLHILIHECVKKVYSKTKIIMIYTYFGGISGIAPKKHPSTPLPPLLNTTITPPPFDDPSPPRFASLTIPMIRLKTTTPTTTKQHPQPKSQAIKAHLYSLPSPSFCREMHPPPSLSPSLPRLLPCPPPPQSSDDPLRPRFACP